MTRVHSDAEGVSVPTCDAAHIAATPHGNGKWIGLVNGVALLGPKGRLRTFKSEGAAFEAADLKAWLIATDDEAQPAIPTGESAQ